MRRLARPLFFAGTVAIVLGFARVHSGRESYDLTDSYRFAWTITYAGLLIVSSYGSGLPDLPRSRRQALTSALLAPGAAALGMSVVQLAIGDALLPRFVVFGSATTMVPWALCCTVLAHGGRNRAELRDRVLLVGESAEATALQDELDSDPERPAILVRHITAREAMPLGARSRPLVESAIASSANLVVLDRKALAEPAVLGQAASLHENGFRVRTLSMFYDGWLGKLPMSELERVSLLFDIREVHGGRYLRIKRLVDLIAAGAGMGVLAFVAPIVALGDMVANRGPLLYRQERVGKLGRTFTILKFRTMVPDSAVVSTWTTVGDPRVTRFGAVLRRTHLDELPQVLNVLRGDLSIVGPRPEQPQYVTELVKKLPFYDMRHLVRPGLTGWAQVKYGYAGDERDALEKLQYEFWYLRYQSLVLDARIVGRTIRSVLGGQGSGR